VGRPERSLPAATGPAAEFASRLRALRRAAGSPSYRQMATTAHYSASTMARAASGRAMPTLEVALAYVSACGGGVESWRRRWRSSVVGSDVRPVGGSAATSAGRSASGGRPQQLPAAVRGFVGREYHLAVMSAHLLRVRNDPEAMRVVTISGCGGVGKTSLALKWAHRHTHLFPDGQLFVNLRGFDPREDAVAPAVALRSLLDALRIPAQDIPSGDDARAGLLRSIIVGRRLLLVLDNAADTGQIMHLLPGSSSCVALVTSRRRLDALTTMYGVPAVRLDMLPANEASDMLARRLGSARLAAEPDAVQELQRYCGGMPLALAIVAARAEAHPEFPLADLAADLRVDADRLDALDTTDSLVGLRTVLSCSYEKLSPASRSLFAELGLLPEGPIEIDAISALEAEPVQRVKRLLLELELAHLIYQPSAGCYRMYNLVRLYAIECATTDLPHERRAAIFRRVAEYSGSELTLTIDRCARPAGRAEGVQIRCQAQVIPSAQRPAPGDFLASAAPRRGPGERRRAGCVSARFSARPGASRSRVSAQRRPSAPGLFPPGWLMVKEAAGASWLGMTRGR
jgi:NB-ARC domain/Helix-turn-helix domain